MGRKLRVGRSAGRVLGPVSALLVLYAGLGCKRASDTEASYDPPALRPVTPRAAGAGAPAATGGTSEEPDDQTSAAGSGGTGAQGHVGTPVLDAGLAFDAGVDLGDGGQSVPPPGVRRIASAPSYLGSVSNGAACEQSYATRGWEPDAPDGTRHPLFLYFTGTNFVLDADAFRVQIAPSAEIVTAAMAERGFVALQADYDNDPLAWASDHTGLLACLFDETRPESLLAAACAMPEVDCALGIATWGHSLGALVAHRAADFDPRVRAAWTTGYGGDADAKLPVTRLRVVNGELDTTNGTVPVLNGITGLTDAECPDDGRSQCLRADGSGWIIVRAADCQHSSADHCWFDKLTCTDGTTVLEPNWVDPASSKPFALRANADWVAATALMP